MQLFFRPTENKYEGEGILPHGTFNNTNEWNPLIKYLDCQQQMVKIFLTYQ